MNNTGIYKEMVTQTTLLRRILETLSKEGKCPKLAG